LDAQPSQYEIVVPKGSVAGDKLIISVEGSTLKLTVPDGVQPGDILTFLHKPKPPTAKDMPKVPAARRRRFSASVPWGATDGDRRKPLQARASVEQGKHGEKLLEVDVPPGCHAGDILKVGTASGLCKLTVPEGTEAGTTLVFRPPKQKSFTRGG